MLSLKAHLRNFLPYTRILLPINKDTRKSEHNRFLRYMKKSIRRLSRRHNIHRIRVSSFIYDLILFFVYIPSKIVRDQVLTLPYAASFVFFFILVSFILYSTSALECPCERDVSRSSAQTTQPFEGSSFLFVKNFVFFNVLHFLSNTHIAIQYNAKIYYT